MANQTDAELIADIRARQHVTVSTRADASPAEMRSALRVEHVREMLAGLPPSDWERHMADVTAREAVLTADLDHWKRRAKALHRQARLLRDCWRFCGDETPSSGQKRCHAAEAERDALRLVVDSECPIGALDLVTSLRVEKQETMDALAAAEATAARLTRQNAHVADVARVSNQQRDAAEARAEALAGRVERMRPLVQAYRDIALLQGGILDHVIPLCDAALVAAVEATDADAD